MSHLSEDRWRSRRESATRVRPTAPNAGDSGCKHRLWDNGGTTPPRNTRPGNSVPGNTVQTAEFHTAKQATGSSLILPDPPDPPDSPDLLDPHDPLDPPSDTPAHARLGAPSTGSIVAMQQCVAHRAWCAMHPPACFRRQRTPLRKHMRLQRSRARNNLVRLCWCPAGWQRPAFVLARTRWASRNMRPQWNAVMPPGSGSTCPWRTRLLPLACPSPADRSACHARRCSLLARRTATYGTPLQAPCSRLANPQIGNGDTQSGPQQ